MSKTIPNDHPIAPVVITKVGTWVVQTDDVDEAFADYWGTRAN